MKNRNLAFKLNFAILSVTAAIFLLVFLYNFNVSGKLILKNVEENTRNLTSSAINKSEGFFRSIEKVALNFSYLIQDQNLDRKIAKRWLAEVVQNNEEVFGSCIAYKPVIRKNDTLYAAPYYYKSGDSLMFRDLGSKEYNYPLWDWYKVPYHSKTKVWSEPYFDEGGGDEVMATFSVPFFDRPGDTGSFAGVVTADVSLEWLQDVVSEIKIFKTGYAFLISHKGVIITHPQEDLVMKETIFSIADSLHDEGLRKIGQDMVDGGEDFVAIEPGFFKEKSWIYYNSLDNNQWSLAFVFPESELYADLHELNRQLVFIAIAGLLVLLSLIVIIARMITRPVRKLVVAAREIGHGNLDLEIKTNHSKDEVGQLQDSFIKMQQELKTFIQDLKTATAEREKVESELKIARQIQMGLVPLKFPPFPHRIDPDIFGGLEPARTVGGDLYDFFFLDEEHLFFVIGDVSGKGIPAAMFMAVTVTAMRTAARLSGSDLSGIMIPVAEHLCVHNPGNFFVTLFAGILNVNNGKVSFVNFGHNPPFVLKKSGTPVRIEPLSGVPLGIRKLDQVAPFDLQLHEGDALVLYTDGITEAGDMKGEFFSEQGLTHRLLNLSGKPSQEIVEDIITKVHEFSSGHEQDDDMAVLTIRYLGVKQSGEALMSSLNIPNQTDSLIRVHETVKSVFEGKVHPMVCFRLELVLEELLTNTIKYGYADDASHEIRIIMSDQPEGIQVRIIEDAKPFNPFEFSDHLSQCVHHEKPGGRGLMLVREMARMISYDSNDHQNILTFLIPHQT